MVDEKDLEIARLQGQLEAMKSGASPHRAKRKGCWPAVGIVAALVALAVLTYAWNRGREMAEREEALQSACRAVSETANEAASCFARMDSSYRGDLSSERTVNAASEQVRQMREDGWR